MSCPSFGHGMHCIARAVTSGLRRGMFRSTLCVASTHSFPARCSCRVKRLWYPFCYLLEALRVVVVVVRFNLSSNFYVCLFLCCSLDALFVGVLCRWRWNEKLHLQIMDVRGHIHVLPNCGGCGGYGKPSQALVLDPWCIKQPNGCFPVLLRVRILATITAHYSSM